MIGVSEFALEYETPVCSFVMMWSTPSWRNAHVVPRSAEADGIGKLVLVSVEDMMVKWRECKASLIEANNVQPNLIVASNFSKKLSDGWLYNFYTSMYGSDTSPQIRPSGPIYIFTGRKPCIPNHLSKRWLRRKFPDWLHKVLVRVTIACQYGTQKWDDCEWVLIV